MYAFTSLLKIALLFVGWGHLKLCVWNCSHIPMSSQWHMPTTSSECSPDTNMWSGLLIVYVFCLQNRPGCSIMKLLHKAWRKVVPVDKNVVCFELCHFSTSACRGEFLRPCLFFVIFAYPRVQLKVKLKGMNGNVWLTYPFVFINIFFLVIGFCYRILWFWILLEIPNHVAN